jgi:hypothetical protein
LEGPLEPYVEPESPNKTVNKELQFHPKRRS